MDAQQQAMIQHLLNEQSVEEGRAKNLTTVANVLLGGGLISGILAFIVPLNSCTQQFKQCTSSGSGGTDGLGCVGGQDSGVATFFNLLGTFITIGVLLGIAAAVCRAMAGSSRNKVHQLKLQILTIQAQAAQQN